MPHILALDIGRRRTGAAFADTSIGVPVALDTFKHTSDDQLIEHIEHAATQRGVELLVLGLPLLPTGDEGDEVSHVRACGELLVKHGWQVSYLDERYTTAKHSASDGDARAACELLSTYLQRTAS